MTDRMNSYSKTAYRKKLDEIFVRYPSVQNAPFGEGYKPGLARMRDFAALLGSPQEKYRTIHVAGTNGKGSVSSMLAVALASTGLKVGLYTSPHILDFRERARILRDTRQGFCRTRLRLRRPSRVSASSSRSLDGQIIASHGEEGPMLIPREYVFDFLCRHESDMDRLDLSFFEITTGLAFKWFADEGVDVAVVEVGLGGRLDSTNIITPDLSIVTSIALDHCALLGDTLEEIAAEKAGIFKSGVPAVVGEYLPETRPVFEEKASEAGSPLTFASDALFHVDTGNILSGMDLKGKYQRKNLVTVLSSIGILREIPLYAGLRDEAKVAEAIERTAQLSGFHGRWERLSESPLAIADIGHNPAALKENFSQLEEMMATGEYSSLIIVYAIMADKDLEGILPFMPSGAIVVLTNPGTRRAMPLDELLRRYKVFRMNHGMDLGMVHTAPTVPEAVALAQSLADTRSIIYYGGSTYLVSEVEKLLQGF